MALPQLTKITFDRCPECGCSDIGEVRLGNGFGSHTCGEWREHVSFRCGAKYEYSPNFSKVLTNEPCSKQGVKHVSIDVTVRVDLQVRKDVDIERIDPAELISIPGTDGYSLYHWKKEGVLEHKRQASIVRVTPVKVGKPKIKG